jgi:hypothetical protein
MPRISFLLVAATLALAAAGACEAKAPAASLRHLSTLKPQDYMKGQPWDDAAFKSALTAVLAPKAPLSRLYAGGPVTDQNKPLDGAVLAWACRAHDCAAVQAFVFLEASRERLSVCWHDEERDPLHDWWLARGAPPAALKPGACHQESDAVAAYRARRVTP